MTDDNTIDIRDRLPPTEIRRLWRKRLPHCHADRIDELVAIREQIRTTQSQLGAMDREFCKFEAGSSNEEVHMQRVRQNISAALVLLNCAEEKLFERVCRSLVLTTGRRAGLSEANPSDHRHV